MIHRVCALVIFPPRRQDEARFSEWMSVYYRRTDATYKHVKFQSSKSVRRNLLIAKVNWLSLRFAPSTNLTELSSSKNPHQGRHVYLLYSCNYYME